MPITKTAGFKASDGVVYATVEEAQASELFALLKQTDGSAGVELANLKMLAQDLVTDGRDALLAILTTGPRSRPKARRTPGTTAPKRAVKRAQGGTAATQAQAEAGFAAIRSVINGIPPEPVIAAT